MGPAHFLLQWAAKPQSVLKISERKGNNAPGSTGTAEAAGRRSRGSEGGCVWGQEKKLMVVIIMTNIL